MDVKGKITIFPRIVKIKNEKGEEVDTKCFCSGSISTKQEDGKYLNKSVEIAFSEKEFPKEKLLKLNPEKCYELQIDAGFLKTRERLSNGELITEIGIMVTKGKLLGSKDIQKRPEVLPDETNDDLPF